MYNVKPWLLKKQTQELETKLVKMYETVIEDSSKVSIGELYDGIIDFGILTSKYRDIYSMIVYPFLSIKEKEKFHYDIVSNSPELSCFYSLLHKIDMVEEAEVIGYKNLDKYNYNLSHLTSDIFIRSQIAEYINPKDERMSQLKKKLLSNLISTSYNALVLNQRVELADYIDLANAYEMYKESEGISYGYDGTNFFPQFGEDIEPLLSELEKKISYHNLEHNNKVKTKND